MRHISSCVSSPKNFPSSTTLNHLTSPSCLFIMKSFVCAAGLAAGASAAILPREQCTFGLTASGGAQGQVGQLSDGQNRVGGGHPTGSYSLNNGAITDSQGRGCILTPPTTQFQCDMGATPSTGFSIGGNGQLEHNGSPTFYACPASSGEYNIYTKSVDQQEKCVQITLSTGGKCTGSGSGSGNSGSASSGSSQPTAPAYSQPASSSASAPASSSAATSQAPPAYSQPATSASSAPASSAPAYSSASQPATSSEAPSYSKPATSASSAPAPSAPAYSSASQPATSPEAPSYSQPATSAPAGSSPAGYGSSTVQSSKPKVTSTVHSTVHSTVQTTMNAPAPSYSQPASSSKPAASGTAPAGSGSASGSACQTSLTGAYQTPHLIVPVNSAQPDKAYGTQYNATISVSPIARRSSAHLSY